MSSVYYYTIPFQIRMIDAKLSQTLINPSSSPFQISFIRLLYEMSQSKVKKDNMDYLKTVLL